MRDDQGISTSTSEIAIIIGAGPAGLTAAYEFLKTTGIMPVIVEADAMVGGLSRTVDYGGNLIDIGGHRFFSKSDRVMEWWLDFLPLEKTEEEFVNIAYHGANRRWEAKRKSADHAQADEVMLIRNRRSRIYFLRKFFDYPISLNRTTMRNLGMIRIARILGSYLMARILPRKEVHLEAFYINRFGKVLYELFFKSYTEKVWGVPCTSISAAWGAQRVKGLSITGMIRHLLQRPFRAATGSLAQKETETSLIERFLYPKYGPGQLWTAVAKSVTEMGGHIHLDTRVTRLIVAGDMITGVEVRGANGSPKQLTGNYVVSTMPVKELVAVLQTEVPKAVREVADGLVYRDFITVGVLADRLLVQEHRRGDKTSGPIRDNWIYIQEPDVLLGRVQIFNNWSPYMVTDPGKVWLGLEYFCNETDDLWKMGDQALAAFAVGELESIGLVAARDVEDSVVIRMPKAYPAYIGTHDRFDEIVKYLDRFKNLFLIGRNGMHRYNNQDHSMLTAMMAVEIIRAGGSDKTSIWSVNTEMGYHESRSQ